MHFFLAILTTASIVYTFHTSFLFQGTRNKIAALQDPQKSKWRNMISFMPLCQYCLAHWVGLGVWAFSGLSWMYLFPIIWLSLHSITVHNLLARLDVSLQSSAAVNAAKVQAISSGKL